MNACRFLFALACLAPALALNRCSIYRRDFQCNQAIKNGCTWTGGTCQVQSEGTCGMCSQDAQCLVPSSRSSGWQCQLLHKNECQTGSPDNVWCGDSQWIAFSYKINPSKPHFVERYYPLFDLTPDLDMKLNVGGHEAKASLRTSTSCSETQTKISASLNIEAKYLAFSGAVTASYDSFHMKKGSHFRADYRIQASLYSVEHGLGLDLGAKLDPQVAAFFQDSSPADIVDNVGEFYASQASLGGVFQLSQVKETASKKESQDVKASFKANGDWVVASFKAEGSVNHSSSSSSSSEHESSQYIALGGDPTTWLALEEDAANLGEIQKNWATTITADDLYPTSLTLHPIWELIQHVDYAKAAAVKTYLQIKWKSQFGVLLDYDNPKNAYTRIRPSGSQECGAGDTRAAVYSLGGGDHSLDACISACRSASDCNFAAFSNIGYCHMFESCNGRDSGRSVWSVYQITPDPATYSTHPHKMCRGDGWKAENQGDRTLSKCQALCTANPLCTAFDVNNPFGSSPCYLFWTAYPVPQAAPGITTCYIKN